MSEFAKGDKVRIRRDVKSAFAGRTARVVGLWPGDNGPQMYRLVVGVSGEMWFAPDEVEAARLDGSSE